MLAIKDTPEIIYRMPGSDTSLCGGIMIDGRNSLPETRFSRSFRLFVGLATANSGLAYGVLSDHKNYIQIKCLNATALYTHKNSLEFYICVYRNQYVSFKREALQDYSR